MDTTLIQYLSGALAVIVFGIIVWRRQRATD